MSIREELMKKNEIYQDILDLLEKNKAGLEVLTEMVETRAREIPVIEEKIRNIRNGDSDDFLLRKSLSSRTEKYLIKAYDPVSQAIVIQSVDNDFCCTMIDPADIIFGEYSFKSQTSLSAEA